MNDPVVLLVGMTQLTPFRMLNGLVLLKCLTPTCARLQGESVDFLAVHSCGPAHARR